MTYDIAQFWLLLLIALVIGGFVGASTWEPPRRPLVAQKWLSGWMPVAAFAFIVGLLVAVSHVVRGRAGLWVETALLAFAVYIAGCLLGGWLRSLSALPEHAAGLGDGAVVPALFFRAGPGWIDVEGQRYGRERAATDAAAQARVGLPGAVGVKPSTALGSAAYAWQDGKSGLFFRAGPGWLDREGRPAGRARAALGAPSSGLRPREVVAAVMEPAKAPPVVQTSAAAAASGDTAASLAARPKAPIPPAAEPSAAAPQPADATGAARGTPAPAPKGTTPVAAVSPDAHDVSQPGERQPSSASRTGEIVATVMEPAKTPPHVQTSSAPAASRGKAASLAARPDAPTAPVAVASPGAGDVAHPGERPPMRDAAHGGTPDDLKLIKGIGPKNERSCNALGVYHFGQIADWSPQHAVWVGHHMAFPGRIEREHWVDQAKLLAAGIETAHAAAVRSGAVVVDADAPLSEAEADAVRTDMPALAPRVADEGRHQGARPLGLAAAHGGTPDDLKRIKGIGKQNEARLHGLGIWHFEQIAAWSADNVKWVGSYLAFPGRIAREMWIAQSKELAAGRPTPFSRRVDAGLVATSADDGSKGQANVTKR